MAESSGKRATGTQQPVMPTLQIRLLGNFQLTYAGEAVMGLHQARLQSLLAYFLLHRDSPHPRQRLAFLFWPDSTEGQAYSNLRKALSALRSTLPHAEQFLRIDAKVVQWRADAPFTLDVAQFEQRLVTAHHAQQRGDAMDMLSHLDAAVALYAGDLLPGCYDDWIAPERERLRERFLEVLVQLSDGLEQVCDYTAAIRQARRLLHVDPLHEETYRRLMRLYVLNDDRTAALRTYHTCATTLQRELGVEPSPPTQQAYAQLLQLSTAPLAQPIRRSQRLRHTLVGRNAEWQQLRFAWARTVQGHAHFVLIGGDPGIGKTRLMEEFGQWVARQGFATAYTRAYAAEGRLAYDPVAEWLRSAPLQRALGTLEDLWLVEVARLAPELRVQRPTLPTPHPLTEGWQRRHFFEALARAVQAVQMPLLLMVDDLQWCDGETLEWLHYLFRFDPHCQLLVVGTARLGEIDADHPLQTLLRTLRQTGQVAEFELTPLAAHETAQLVNQVADRTFDAEQVAVIHRVAEGNPLLVREMVWAPPVDGPSSSGAVRPSSAPWPEAPLGAKMAAVIEARLAQLSPAARQLATLAATIGRSFTFALLRQASSQDEEQLVAALDELWQRRIVREKGSDGYDFTHDKIREVAYTAISPMRQQQLHQRVAQALEVLHAEQIAPVSAQIAAHYRQAMAVSKAADYYLRAADEMQFCLAYDETRAYIQQGLTMLQNSPHSQENLALELAMQLALGRLLVLHEGFASLHAIQAFEAARQLCLQLENLPQLFRVQQDLRVCYANRGDYNAAFALGESNLALADQLGDRTALNLAHFGLGLLHCWAGNFALAKSHLEQALQITSASPSQTPAHGRAGYFRNHLYVLTLWLLGYADTARAQWQPLALSVDANVGPFSRVIGYEHDAMFCYWQRQFDRMQTYGRKLLALAETHEFALYRWVGNLYVTAAAAALGEAEESLARLDQSVDALKGQGVLMLTSYYLAMVADVCRQLGHTAKGIATLDEALALAGKLGEHFWTAEMYRLRGELLVTQGALVEAEVNYQRAIDVARSQAAKWLELRATLSLSRLWQAQARRQQAYALLAPIYHWFSEGFDTPDLQEAQALLAVLAA